MGSLGGPELLIIGLFWLLPIFVLYRVAGARGQSRSYAWWGVLGLIGMVVGLLIMIAMPSRPPATATAPRKDGPPDVF